MWVVFVIFIIVVAVAIYKHAINRSYTQKHTEEKEDLHKERSSCEVQMTYGNNKTQEDDLSFNEWVVLMKDEGMPTNEATNLAIQALRVCFDDNQIDALDKGNEELKITDNPYALFDYGMLSYFVFRAYLCSTFPRKFVELFDGNMQYLMASYFYCFYDIELDEMLKLITSRSDKYEKIVASNISSEEMKKQLFDVLMIFLGRDFRGEPLSNYVSIVGLDKEFMLRVKVMSYFSVMMNKLHNLCQNHPKK